MVRSGRKKTVWSSTAQAVGSKAWMCWRRASGHCRGSEFSGRNADEKTIVGCWVSRYVSDSKNRAWTKKMTSRR